MLGRLYDFNDPQDQLAVLNKLVFDSINQHAPLKRAKLTRLAVPWIKELDIIVLQNKLKKHRFIDHNSPSKESWINFQNIRNELKKKINDS